MGRTHTHAPIGGVLRAIKAQRKWTRALLIRKFGGRCHLCGGAVTLGDETADTYATIDHMVPLSRGGKDTLGNLALAHLGCNTMKGNRLPTD